MATSGKDNMIPPVIVIRDPATRRRAQQVIAELPHEDIWDVRISLHKSRRSLAQNALLWGVWYPAIHRHIGEATGEWYSGNEIHEWVRSKFLPPGRPVTVGGRTVIARASTAALSVGEFAELLNRIEEHCRDRLGLVLPHPEDCYYAAIAIEKSDNHFNEG